MLTGEERNLIIASLRKLPAALESAVNGLTEEQLDLASGEGEWTIRQIVHHVADANLNFFARTKWILTEDNPALKVFEQENWAKLPDATESAVQDSLLILRGLHSRWVDLLEHMPADGWMRRAVHWSLGEVTLEELLVSYARHGESHVEQIVQMASR